MSTEKETRQKIIDKKLLIAGWDVKDLTKVIEEFDIDVEPSDCDLNPNNPFQGHQFSDYVLLGKDGKPLAVVEAKKTSKDAEIGREQAKQYCYNIKNHKSCELPFCFYTNGHEIFFWDLENYPPKKVYGFPAFTGLARDDDEFKSLSLVPRTRWTPTARCKASTIIRFKLCALYYIVFRLRASFRLIITVSWFTPRVS